MTEHDDDAYCPVGDVAVYCEINRPRGDACIQPPLGAVSTLSRWVALHELGSTTPGYRKVSEMNQPPQGPHGQSGAPLWRVNVNGAWQPAQSEAQIADWVRHGYVGPQTLVQHATWPNPIPLGQVPSFVRMFGGPPVVTGQGYGPSPGYRPPPSNRQQARPAALPINFYAQVALACGVCALLFVGITGIPAILLGYKAIKEIDAEPARSSGKGAARTSIVLGWIGCGLGGLLLGRVMGDSSITLGIVGVVLGLGAIGGAFALSRKWSWGIARRLTIASTPALLILGSGLGMVGARAEEAERAALCQKNEDDASSYLAAKNFPSAHTAVDAARVKCAPTDDAKLADLDRDIAQEEKAAEKAEAVRKAAEAAAASAEREKDATATFPTKATEILATYKRALGETSAGQASAADEDLNAAETELSSFTGTRVASTKDWIDLNAKLAGLRQRLQPQLDRIAAKAEKEKQAAAEIDALRGTKPTNSAWDGSIRCVESYLKQSLNDPDSYQHVSTTVPVAVGPYWVVDSVFRAKNGFGALTVHQARFKIQQDQVVSMQEE